MFIYSTMLHFVLFLKAVPYWGTFPLVARQKNKTKKTRFWSAVMFPSLVWFGLELLVHFFHFLAWTENFLLSASRMSFHNCVSQPGSWCSSFLVDSTTIGCTCLDFLRVFDIRPNSALHLPWKGPTSKTLHKNALAHETVCGSFWRIWENVSLE